MNGRALSHSMLFSIGAALMSGSALGVLDCLRIEFEPRVTVMWTLVLCTLAVSGLRTNSAFAEIQMLRGRAVQIGLSVLMAACTLASMVTGVAPACGGAP